MGDYMEKKSKKCCDKEFYSFTFPRSDASGQAITKVGYVRWSAIQAIEPGTNDGLTHLHLANGKELIVLEPIGAVLGE